MCVPLLRCADWTIVNRISALGPLTLLAQAEDDAVLFLGEDFLPWMVLALGAAMVVGNIAALTRPPDPQDGAAPLSAGGACHGHDRGGAGGRDLGAGEPRLGVIAGPATGLSRRSRASELPPCVEQRNIAAVASPVNSSMSLPSTELLERGIADLVEDPIDDALGDLDVAPRRRRAGRRPRRPAS